MAHPGRALLSHALKLSVLDQIQFLSLSHFHFQLQRERVTLPVADFFLLGMYIKKCLRQRQSRSPLCCPLLVFAAHFAYQLLFITLCVNFTCRAPLIVFIYLFRLQHDRKQKQMEAQAKKMQAAKAAAANEEAHDEEEEAQPVVIDIGSSSEEEGKQLHIL